MNDDSILAMIRQGLGVSMMYQKVVEGFEEGLIVRPISKKPERRVGIGWKNWETMPFAARCFVEFVMDKYR